jgi:hypothetical protein
VIDDSWKKYREQVIPAGAPAVQIEESRRAFYAGALACFGVFLSLEGEDEETPADLAKLDRLKEQLDAYCDEMGALASAGQVAS